MPENLCQDTAEMERAELGVVVQALSRSPRLAKLLGFLGERYFTGTGGKLTEYDIATEVFERSKSNFDPSVDAIARVEAHRLRKKLKEYYSGEGQDHKIQIVLPLGTYLPVFSRRVEEHSDTPGAVLDPELLADVQPVEEPEPSSSASDFPPEPPEIAPRGAPGDHPSGVPVFRWILVFGALAAFVWVAFLWLRHRPLSLDAKAQTPSASQAAPVDLTGTLPLRIMSGYSGQPQTDSAGLVWKPDMYFHNGGVWHRGESAVQRTNKPILFAQWRTGDFFYDIPLKPGIYELHLYFVTSNAEESSVFTVSINGQRALTAFDINSDALGQNIADERVFRDVSPSKDGYLHLGFTSEGGEPSLNGIEILPGLPHKQLPIRIVTQQNAFTDRSGQLWSPDDYYMNGRMTSSPQPVSGTADPDLFAFERYGHFTYALPVDPRDRYTVVLHFAEFYFGVHAPGGPGQRVFRVLCNGNTLLDDFDIFKEAGSLHVVTKTFRHIKPSAQGKLNLTFEPVVNNATVSGIEVLDESE